MTQQGFIDFLYDTCNSKTGAIKSYIMAIHIIDELFLHDDVFGLHGKSVTSIDDLDLLMRINEFIRAQQYQYKKGNDSFFDNINPNQKSYAAGGFCSAAFGKLLDYYAQDAKEKEAWVLLNEKPKATGVSKKLIELFDIDKEGEEVEVKTRARLGQGYFRKMVLHNFDYKCCVTGLNVPQVLRASHIVGWAEDKANRMNPENGLCLSATYDAAFDKHLISFDDDYRMIVGKEIKDYYTADVTKQYFEKYEGRQITLPSQYLPSKKLLERHRELMVG